MKPLGIPLERFRSSSEDPDQPRIPVVLAPQQPAKQGSMLSVDFLDGLDDALLGSRVRLRGLTGPQAELNGAVGVATEFHLLKGIYFVQLDGESVSPGGRGMARVRTHQLVRADDSSSSSSDESGSGQDDDTVLCTGGRR